MTTRTIADHGISPNPLFNQIPVLRDLFIPCPICNGTTDIDYLGYVLCYSCGQSWTISGKPLKKVADNFV